MIGDREGGEFQVAGAGHEAVQAARPIEQGILGVNMQMNKIRVRHDDNVASGRGSDKRETILAFPRDAWGCGSSWI